MSFNHVARALAVLGTFTLAGCLETPQAGLPSGAKAKYSRMGLVSGVSDQVVSTYWQGAMSTPQPTDGRLGWDASAATVTLVKQQLTQFGTRVAVVPAYTSAAARANDVVLVLEQTPLNTLGQDYNPGRDFFALGGGLIALAAVTDAEKKKDTTYQRRFVIWIRNPEVSKAWIGENACTVGLTALLVDPKTGKSVTEGTQVIGRSIIPGALTAKDWASLPKPEQASVLSYCRSALGSAVSQALLKLGIVQ